MELERQYCIYCKRELPKNKRRKHQWHVKCHQSIYGSTSDIIYQGEIVYKNDYEILVQLEKEISDRSSHYRLVKLTSLIHMFENFGYVVSNKAVIGLDLKFQLHTPFYKLNHLQTLNVAQFTKLPDSIGNLKNLHSLLIKHCNIQDLPDSLGKLPVLENLEISGITSLQSLPSFIGKLKKLRRLILAPINERVKIQVLPETISNLTNLEFFYISGTNVKKLPQNFDKLQNLKELYLLSRSLVEIPSLGSFKNLKILECQAKIVKIPESFSELVELEEVKLYNNLVQELPSVLKLQQLRKFEVFKSSLALLPEGISELANLRTIIVSFNPLKKLPESLSELQNLEILDASQTDLTKLPNIFVFPELKRLNLDKTFITKLPDEIVLPKLVELKISCYLPGLSEFFSLKQLIITNTLPGKELDEFPEEIFKLNNLLSMDIGKANFTRLPDKFDQIEKLRILYIHKTNIRSLDGIPKYLQDKMIARNMIIYVHPEFDFEGIKDIINLRIKF